MIQIITQILKWPLFSGALAPGTAGKSCHRSWN